MKSLGVNRQRVTELRCIDVRPQAMYFVLYKRSYQRLRGISVVHPTSPSQSQRCRRRKYHSDLVFQFENL